MKTKLKDTESKFKNAIQEKTKLEVLYYLCSFTCVLLDCQAPSMTPKFLFQGEKAFAERELKRLQGQKALLERDISKRDSLANRRRDSTADRGSRLFDQKKAKAVPSDLSMQVMTI